MTAFPRSYWRDLEKAVAVGDRWHFADGETCTVTALVHDGMAPAVLCITDHHGQNVRYPIHALVRSADKLAA